MSKPSHPSPDSPFSESRWAPSDQAIDLSKAPNTASGTDGACDNDIQVAKKLLDSTVQTLTQSEKLKRFSVGRAESSREYWEFLTWMSEAVNGAVIEAMETLWSAATSSKSREERVRLAMLGEKASKLIHEGYSKAAFTSEKDVVDAKVSRHMVDLPSLRQMFLERAAESAIWRIRWDLVQYRTPGAELVRALVAAYVFERHQLLNVGVQSSIGLDAIRATLLNGALLLAFDTYALSPDEIAGFDALARSVSQAVAVEAESNSPGPVVSIRPISGRISLQMDSSGGDSNILFALMPVIKALADIERQGAPRGCAERFKQLITGRLTPQRRKAVRNKSSGCWGMLKGFELILKELPLATERRSYSVACDVLDLSEGGAKVEIKHGASIDIRPGELMLGGADISGFNNLSVACWVRRNGEHLTLGLRHLGSDCRLFTLSAKYEGGNQAKGILFKRGDGSYGLLLGSKEGAEFLLEPPPIQLTPGGCWLTFGEFDEVLGAYCLMTYHLSDGCH